MKEFLEVIGITICLWVAVIAMVYVVIPDYTPQDKADCRIARSKK